MNIHEHLKKLKTAQSPSRATDNNSAAKKSELWERSGCLSCLIGFLLIMVGCSKCQDTSGVHWHKADPFFNAGYFFFSVGCVILLIILIVRIFKSFK